MDLEQLVRTGSPSPSKFPTFCNPNAVEIWITVVRNLPTDPWSAWTQALRLFSLACKDAGLLPFASHSEVNVDQVCRSFLATRRRHLVRFANNTKLLKDVRVWRKDVEVTRDSFGFAIRLTLRVEIRDPQWFRRLFKLPPYRFQRLRNGYAWECKLDPAITFFVTTYNHQAPRAWSMGYVIQCPLVVDPKGLPFKDYVLRRLWMPVSGIRPNVGDRIRRL